MRRREADLAELARTKRRREADLAELARTRPVPPVPRLDPPTATVPPPPNENGNVTHQRVSSSSLTQSPMDKLAGGGLTPLVVVDSSVTAEERVPTSNANASLQSADISVLAAKPSAHPFEIPVPTSTRNLTQQQVNRTHLLLPGPPVENEKIPLVIPAPVDLIVPPHTGNAVRLPADSNVLPAEAPVKPPNPVVLPPHSAALLADTAATLGESGE